MKNKKIFLSLFLSISIIISSFSGTVTVNANEVMSTDISSAAIDLERSQHEYLKDEKTVYPITIDPTIIVSYNHDGAGAIEDVTLNSFTPQSGTSYFLYVGREQNGSLDRMLMRFPNLSLDGICANQIISAKVYLTDLGCQSDQDITVNCYVYKRTATAWSESGTTSWSGVGNDYIGNFQDTHVISNGNGNADSNKYSFNILNAARAWANDFQDPDMGLVFKASAAFENQSGTGIQRWKKKFASYNRATDRPYLVITYVDGIGNNSYSSEYDDEKINNYGSNPSFGSDTAIAQYKMNCYGYAMGFILKNYYTYTYSNRGYLQCPGEFAKENGSGQLLHVDVFNLDPSEMMDNVINNMYLDAARFSYEIEEISVNNSAPQLGGDSRLIAVVTGNYNSPITDFHFYIQHDNHKWSHKTGVGYVSNLSINSPHEELTNDNIKVKANQGCYTGGELKFLKITKHAVLDYPHGNKDAVLSFPQYWPNNFNENTVSLKEIAGDYLYSAVEKELGVTSARIDFAKDHDVFFFIPTSTRDYTITSSDTVNADINCVIRDATGTLYRSDTANGQLNTTLRMVKGQKYFIDVYNNDETIDIYALIITKRR